MRKSIIAMGFVLSCGMLFGQHGGHGGAVGGHMAASGGHFSAGAHTMSRPSSAPMRGSYAAPARSSYRPSTASYRTGAGPYRSSRTNGRRRVGYGYPGLVGYPYGYPGYYPYGGLNLFGDDLDDPNLQDSYVSNGYAGDPGDQQQEADAGPYEGPYPDPQQYTARPPYDPGGDPSAGGLPQPKTALIFKDGRRLDVQNYVATRTRILVGDSGITRDIPVSALDIPATEAANETAGVDFSLPGSPSPSQ